MIKQGRYSPIAKLNANELLALVDSQWENFKSINGHYPTAQEIDESMDMVTTKTIQRRLFGVVNCRIALGHSITNYSKGETRASTASNSMTISVNDENELQAFLCNYFGPRPNVAREEPYLEFNRQRSDFGVYHKGGHFFVDVFTAKDKWSLVGGINHKQNKIKNLIIKDKIYYVANNVTQEVIDYVVKNKKNRLPDNIIILSASNFKNYCKTLTPIVQ